MKRPERCFVIFCTVCDKEVSVVPNLEEPVAHGITMFYGLEGRTARYDYCNGTCLTADVANVLASGLDDEARPE